MSRVAHQFEAYYYPQTRVPLFNLLCQAQVKMSKSRDYVFTTNNYTQAHIDHIAQVDCVYVVYGKEVGEKCGTPHLQGYIRFKHPKSLSAASKLLPHSYLARKKGTFEDAINYCKKQEDVYERGEIPMTQEEKGESNKRRFADAFEAAKEGRMDDIPEDLRTRYYGTYKKIREDHLPKPVTLDTLQNEWRYGPTGTGKTRSAFEEYPDAFIKKANTKWWDGYMGEEVVIIDDVDKYHVSLGYELKIWLDHNPFPAERKGGTMMIRPKKVILTSNYHPCEIWQDEQTLQPVLRRVELKRYGEIPSIHPGYYIE